MIIKDTQWEKCNKCGSRRAVSREAYGCDVCKKELAIGEQLDLSMIRENDGEVIVYNLCSWPCVFEKLSRIKPNNYIELPCIGNQGTDEFFTAIKEWKTGVTPKTDAVHRA